MDDAKDAYCHCEKCRKLSPSDQQLTVLNAMIRRLRQDDPEASLAYLAYINTLTPPETVKPEEGIFLEYAPYERDMQKPVSEMPEAEIRERVDYFLDMVGLKKFQDYYPDQLSASMLQRAAIARAFAVKPEVLLMDEPYGQLDIELRFKLEDELIRLWREVGTTVIFITHNIEEAVYLSERILVLTNKPTKIKAEISNTMAHPRDIADPEFVELRNQVTDLIKWW